MNATKVLLDTDAQGRLIEPPPLPPLTRVEAIFLLPDLPARTPRRRPPADIAGRGRILGDLIAPPCRSEDWDALT